MASGGQIKGITIKIEGDTSDLAKSLTKVNGDIKKTSSALKDVEKALKLDPGNTELLAQKQQLLAKQIEQTAQKLELEQTAANDAKEALELGNISQEEYATLQAEVASTSASLEELQQAAADAGNDLGDAGDEAEDAGEQAEESGSAFEGWGTTVAAAAAAAAAAVAAVSAAIYKAGEAMVSMTLDTGNLADQLNTMSSVTGLSTETLQEMNYATELLDVSTDTISGSMVKLLKVMGNAADGSQSALDAFSALGISIYDNEGSLRDLEDVYWEAIDALGEIDSETRRDMVAMDLFGRSARDLNPLIEAGSEGFAELAEEAHEVGYVMDQETLDAFNDLDDNMRRVDNGVQAAKQALGNVLLPILTDLSSEGVGFLNDFTNAVLETNGDIGQLGDVIDAMLPQALAIFEEYMPLVLELGGSIIETLATALLDNLDIILQRALDIVLSIVEGILRYLPQLLPAVIGMINQIITFLINNLGLIVSTALQIVLAVAQGISDNIGQLIPSVVAAVLQIVETLTEPDSIMQLIDAALQIMLAIGQGLIDAIPEVVSRVPEIIANIIEAFSQLGPQLASNAATWGADMIQGIVDGISNAGSTLRNGLSNAASTISSYLGFSVPETGPLHEWAYNNPGADMIDLFTEGMEDEQASLQRSLYQTSNVIYEGMSGTDYTGALNGISSQLAGLGGTNVINVYLGTNKLGTAVVGAMNSENARTGGTA